MNLNLLDLSIDMTIIYICRSMNPRWPGADTPWNPQKNPDNPFGPFIIILIDKRSNS